MSQIHRCTSEIFIFWESTMLHRRSPLKVFEIDALSRIQLKDADIKTYIYLFRSAFHPNLTVMDYKDLPYTAYMLNDLLKRDDIRRLYSQVRSSYINKINQIPQGLKTALLNGWYQLRQELIKCLI